MSEVASFTLEIDQAKELEEAESATFQALESMAKQLESVENLRDVFVRLSSQVIGTVLGFHDQMQRRWELLCQAGMAGKAEEVHAQREVFLRRFDTCVGFVKQASRLAHLASVLLGKELPGSQDLPREEEKLQKLKTEIFEKWNDLEDLEDLLAARFPLPASKLESVGRNHSPPIEWYEQEGKPF